MCGRTATTKAPGEIAQACSYKCSKTSSVKQPTWGKQGSSQYKPSYNKGPKSCSVILTINASTNDQERILLPMQWGLVPSWHKGDAKKFAFNMINCRLDTITKKKSFTNALEKRQRCVVLADGFYEWHTNGKQKQPYYIQLKAGVTPQPLADEQMLMMAGLFDKHVSKEGEELYTYSIITVDSSNTFKWLHHRMPAILETPEAVNDWLNVKFVHWKDALKLLLPTDCLTWYPVSNEVNNVRHDTPECIRKVDIEREVSKKLGSGKVMSAWLTKSKKSMEPPAAKKLKC